MKLTPIVLGSIVALFFTATPLCAQSTGEEPANDRTEDASNPSNRRFWQANVSNGHYMVALDRICNISMHEYVLDGTLVINEVTVDTSGRAIARFYHIAPITDSMGNNEVKRITEKGLELLDRASNRVDSDIHNMAQKNYPTTTHAGMIEYRILDLKDLEALYNSLKKAWESGKGRKFTIK